MSKVTLFHYTGKKYKNGESPIMIRIITNRKSKYIATGFSALPNEWDGKTFNNAYKRNRKLSQPEFEEINSSVIRKLNKTLDEILVNERQGKIPNLKVIKDKIKNQEQDITFDKLSEKVISENKKAGRIGNAINYRTMLNVLQKFNGKEEIKFESIDYTWLKSFETWHLEKENTINSLSVYLRAARAIFNRAINEKLINPELYPFGKAGYQISSSPTRKRAISKESIKAIQNLDLPENSSLWHTRNYTIFSFYMRGMNFIDIANLKLKNIVADRVEYIRIKTKRKNARSFSIAILPEVQKIIDFYLNLQKPDDYLFPILFRKGDPERLRKDEANALKNYNKYLNKLAGMVDVKVRITSYSIRHSWATIGKRMGIDDAKISDGLGHADTATTRAYLDSILDEDLDEANSKITE